MTANHPTLYHDSYPQVISLFPEAILKRIFKLILYPKHRTAKSIFKQVINAKADNVEIQARPGDEVYLTQVCQKWRTLLLSTPSLWDSNIPIVQGPISFDQFRQQAPSIHRVRIYDTIIQPSQEESQAFENMTTLAEKLPLILINDNLEVLRLKFVNFNDIGLDRMSMRLQVERMENSKLEILDLTGCYFNVSVSGSQIRTLPAGLKVLKVRDVDPDVAFGAAQWSKLLSSLSQIQEVEIRNAIGNHHLGKNENRETNEIVDLRGIKTFRLASTINLGACFLERVAFPEFKCLDLDCFCEEGTSEDAMNRVLDQICRIFEERFGNREHNCPELWFGLTTTSVLITTHPSHRNNNLDSNSVSFSIRFRIPFKSKVQSRLPTLLLGTFIAIENATTQLESIGLTGSYVNSTIDQISFEPIYILFHSHLDQIRKLTINASSTKALTRVMDIVSSLTYDRRIMFPYLNELVVECNLHPNHLEGANAVEDDNSEKVLRIIERFIKERKKRTYPVTKVAISSTDKALNYAGVRQRDSELQFGFVPPSPPLSPSLLVKDLEETWEDESTLKPPSDDEYSEEKGGGWIFGRLLAKFRGALGNS